MNHIKFINVDVYPYPHVDYVQDIGKLRNFSDESVDLIYASHCLEHFKYHRTKSVLFEWYRVLKVGGVLRVSVPDFDKLIEIYNKHDCNPDVIIPQLLGGQDNRHNYHLTVLNRVNLASMLGEVGFKKIKDWQPGSDDLTTFNDLSIYQKIVEDESYDISLNIEAIK